MVKKQKGKKLKPMPTKRQLARWQQQRRLQRIASGIGVIFMIFILGYVGHGYYTNEVKPFHQPAIKVNDRVFNMDHYIKVLRLYSQGQPPAQLSAMTNIVVGIIQGNELIRQGAESLGISIGTEEIDKELRRLNLPNDKVYRDVVYSQLLPNKLMKEHFSTKIPSAGEQVHVMAMLLDSEKTAKETATKLRDGGDFASLAKAFSQEKETRDKGGDLGWLPKGLAKILVGSQVLEEVAFSVEPGKLSQSVYDAEVVKNAGYWLIKVVDKKPEQGIQGKAILLSNEEEAKVVKAKLELGEDFATLAKLYSQHQPSKEKGGDLGWLQPNTMSKAFDQIAFALEPGKLSEPVLDDTVQTKGGYWLIKVVERDDNRQLEEKVRKELASKAFDDWLSELEKKSVVESYIDEKKKAWALTQVAGRKR